MQKLREIQPAVSRITILDGDSGGPLTVAENGKIHPDLFVFVFVLYDMSTQNHWEDTSLSTYVDADILNKNKKIFFQASMSSWVSWAMAVVVPPKTRVCMQGFFLQFCLPYFPRGILSLEFTLWKILEFFASLPTRCLREGARFPPLDEDDHRGRRVLIFFLKCCSSY